MADSSENRERPSAQERELFLRLRAMPLADRLSTLDALCANQPELRRQIEELIQEQNQLGGFLETPAVSVLVENGNERGN